MSVLQNIDSRKQIKILMIKVMYTQPAKFSLQVASCCPKSPVIVCTTGCLTIAAKIKLSRDRAYVYKILIVYMHHIIQNEVEAVFAT